MTARASFVGEATFSGCIAFCERPRAEVECWLPAGMRLAGLPEAREASAIVAFAFGTHTGSATRFGGFDLRLGIVYEELGIFLPGVVRDAGQPELYVARMFSSYYPAVWNGNTHYGFAKELVEIHRLGCLFSVIGPERRELLQAVTEPIGEWRSPAPGALAALDRVREVFALPVLGRLADGRLVRSRFRFEFGAARARAVDACVSMGATDFADGANGSLEVRDMTWRLSWPERMEAA